MNEIEKTTQTIVGYTDHDVGQIICLNCWKILSKKRMYSNIEPIYSNDDFLKEYNPKCNVCKNNLEKFDTIRYYRKDGYINNRLCVFLKIGERIWRSEFLDILKNEFPNDKFIELKWFKLK